MMGAFSQQRQMSVYFPLVWLRLHAHEAYWLSETPPTEPILLERGRSGITQFQVLCTYTSTELG